jgi:hypothetical protein
MDLSVLCQVCSDQWEQENSEQPMVIKNLEEVAKQEIEMIHYNRQMKTWKEEFVTRFLRSQEEKRMQIVRGWMRNETLNGRIDSEEKMLRKEICMIREQSKIRRERDMIRLDQIKTRLIQIKKEKHQI